MVLGAEVCSNKKQKNMRKLVFCKHDFCFKLKKKDRNEMRNRNCCASALCVVLKLLNSELCDFKSMSSCRFNEGSCYEASLFISKAKLRLSRHNVFLFCANLFHCTVEGCIPFVLTLCKSTVFFVLFIF